MDKIIINGGKSLEGNIRVSGAKNAVLPILAGSLLTTTTTRLLDVPNLADVGVISSVLKELGAEIEVKPGELDITVPNLIQTEAPYEYVRKMRASFLVMGHYWPGQGKPEYLFPALRHRNPTNRFTSQGLCSPGGRNKVRLRLHRSKSKAT
ncbi:hypothetical protein N752_30365 [Desulforamulus aquiferis]|nr:hypothetical protein N752_30365 [Desulforamulus aquiferis]